MDSEIPDNGIEKKKPDDMPDLEIEGEEPEESVWRGVYKAEHFADEVLHDYEFGIEPGESIGWTSLNDLYRIKRRQWSVITGIPSHGKSTFLDNVMVNLAKSKHWKFLICSPENQPIERHIESLVEIYSGKQFCHPAQLHPQHIGHGITEDELGEAMLFVNTHFRFICPEETDFNIDYILELAQTIKNDPEAGLDFDGFVLDPYNELEHKRPPGMSETEYISQVLSKWRRFCRSANVHGWLVAHPAKLKEIQQVVTDAKTPKKYQKPSLYDIAGSAHWRNKADMGVVVYRNIGEKPETTEIDVQKVRFRECGSLGQADLRYDFLCNRFVEHEVELLWNRARMRNDADRVS